MLLGHTYPYTKEQYERLWQIYVDAACINRRRAYCLRERNRCAMCGRPLGFHYLDSGALYRLVALASLRRGIALDHVEALTALARTAAVACTDGQATLESVDVSHDIRAEDV